MRLRDLPALFWVLLAGREARKRFRLILAARKRAALERRVRKRAGEIERDVRAGIAAGLNPQAGALETLAHEIRRQRGGVLIGRGNSSGPRRLPWLLSECGCCGSRDLFWVEERGVVCADCERRRNCRHGTVCGKGCDRICLGCGVSR